MPLTGRKRGAEEELRREGGGAEASGGEAGGSGAAPPSAPFADATPALSPADVHVLLADDEKISRLVTAKLLRTCVAARARRRTQQRGRESPSTTHTALPRPPTAPRAAACRSRATRARAPLAARSCGYQVTAVESGRAALLALGAAPTRYHLILTDVAMPDVDGLQVLRYVRSQPALHALPVVMMSAHENAGTGARRAAEKGLLGKAAQNGQNGVRCGVAARAGALANHRQHEPAAQPRRQSGACALTRRARRPRQCSSASSAARRTTC
jgi:CheY-like chemotaxis protein